MKISEILVESQQVDEGPILNKIGAGIGKVAGTVAKGIGAVAGGVVGAGKALAKGYQAGKTTVGGAGDDTDTAPADNAAGASTTPAATKQPATAKGGGVATQPAATDVNKAGPAGTAPAQNLQGVAKAAADKTAAATQSQNAGQAGQTMYATVKANIDKLDKKGKQRILQLLQKSMAAPEATPTAGKAPAGGKPAAGGAPEKVAAPATEPADAGAGAMGSMANQLGSKPANTMANAPVSKTNTAKPGNPNAAPVAEPQAAPAADPAPAGQPAPTRTGGKVKGQLSQTPRAVKRREANAAKTKQQAPAVSQAQMDADRERIMGVTSDSIVRKQPMMAESFSLFRKR